MSDVERRFSLEDVARAQATEWHVGYGAGQAAASASLDVARQEIQANRAQGVNWEPSVSASVTRWYAEGYDRGLRDADAILARLQSEPIR